MDDKTQDELPARVEDCRVRVLSFDPLLGTLHLETDEGEIELVMNRNAATLLAMNLVDFLGAEPMNEEAANELN